MKWIKIRFWLQSLAPLPLFILESRMVFQSPINTSHLKTERKDLNYQLKELRVLYIEGWTKILPIQNIVWIFSGSRFLFYFNFRKISHNYKRLPVFLKKRMSLRKIPPVVHHLTIKWLLWCLDCHHSSHLFDRFPFFSFFLSGDGKGNGKINHFPYRKHSTFIKRTVSLNFVWNLLK